MTRMGTLAASLMILVATESIQLKHAFKEAQLPSLIEFLKTE